MRWEPRSSPRRRPEALGLLGPDESYAPSVPDIDETRRKLVITLKELGKLQTGQPVQLRWCHDAARIIAEDRTGECDFDLLSHDSEPALRDVLKATEDLIAAELKKVPADPDIPF
jgi:hypothetical protein